MPSLVPGQASFARLPDPAGDPRVALVICEQAERLPEGRYVFKLRGALFLIEIETITVPVVVVMVSLTSAAQSLLYLAWVDELAPCGAEVLDSLCAQSELRISAAGVEGKTILSTTIPNVLRKFALRNLDKVAELAVSFPWNGEQFDAAKSIVESQYPVREDFWERLKDRR
jgi:hypothetical protein